jgi:Ca2+-binding EF-hand superfamily protein
MSTYRFAGSRQSDAASEEQQRAEFREADTDGNGEISSSEYLKTWQDFAREMGQSLTTLQPHCKGRASVKLLGGLPGGAEALHAIKPEEIFDSFNSFDLDGSGNISEDEWVQVLRANAARAAEMQARQAKAEL